MKHVNGRADCTGPAVQLGAEEKYFPTCFNCYRNSLLDAGQSPVEYWANEESIADQLCTDPTKRKDLTDVYVDDIECNP